MVIALICVLLLVSVPSVHGNICCQRLTGALGSKVVNNDDRNFRTIQRSYWTNLESGLTPGCFVQPVTADDVSIAVKILTAAEHSSRPECKFAIKSGGHTAWPGAANVQDGVTFDMSTMNEVTISPDKSQVHLGTGNKWADVYTKLGHAGIAVAGGRWGNVGVGGLLTSGGLSFYQGTEGMSCNGILNHQVVLADGSILNANAQENADLHRALKGGGNNFGIVTRFTMKAWPQTEFWGGMIYGSSLANEASAMRWFQGFANSSAPTWDPYAQTMFMNMAFLGVSGSGCLATHSKPSTMRMTDRAPAAFAPFYRTAALTPVGKTTPLAVAQANAQRQAYGGRSLWVTMTHKNSAAYMKALQSLTASRSSVLTQISLVSQPIWAAPRRRARAGDLNVLGLENTSDDLVVALAMVSWTGSAFDSAGRSAAKAWVEAAQAKAKSMGVYHPYIFTNYAADFQDPMAGYGDRSLNFMRQVSRKFDPQGTFQKQVPGGFKLWRSGSSFADSRSRQLHLGTLAANESFLISGDPAQWQHVRESALEDRNMKLPIGLFS